MGYRETVRAKRGVMDVRAAFAFGAALSAGFAMQAGINGRSEWVPFWAATSVWCALLVAIHGDD
jgi:hypothetical protein